MNKDFSPVSLPEQKFSLKPILIETEVNDIGEKVGQILLPKEHPDPLTFDLALRVTEETFCRLINIKNFGVHIGHK
jgi:hypothetical protein